MQKAAALSILCHALLDKKMEFCRVHTVFAAKQLLHAQALVDECQERLVVLDELLSDLYDNEHDVSGEIGAMLDEQAQEEATYQTLTAAVSAHKALLQRLVHKKVRLKYFHRMIDSSSLTWLLQVAATLPRPEKRALKEMLLRQDARLNSMQCVDDVHRVVTIAAVSHAFKAWYSLFDALAMSTDAACHLEQNNQTADHDVPLSASLTYGEVDFFGIASLLAILRPRPGQTFCDLGHGTGRAIFAAATLYPELRLMGIELVPSLYHASRRALDSYEMPHPQHIQLVHGDLTTFDWWSCSDIVFVNATAFSAELWNTVQLLALRLQPGALFVSLTHCLAKGLSLC
ncbi:hypothetical protein, variant 1 [Aphanomyces invadans]|uniref:Histone-lysine N-methyltransferase, H3 lysine-79 specific n=1 Tax=Aphanomyces invadans TaxID=157072 RepID=A0A024T8D8_9STRA|nr:hypothetical protein, variant 1 [Aphanomyces invadans]ETV90268.1 hypothetical protein, variant 1 [Aphanomyces invadans]|eukprot:XP_008881093.1 hypothetical protein, variant 1 [Aphanomyces invadans]